MFMKALGITTGCTLPSTGTRPRLRLTHLAVLSICPLNVDLSAGFNVGCKATKEQQIFFQRVEVGR
jgi:hypothetical protein